MDNLGDGGLTIPGGEVVILGKTVLEGLKPIFELRDVDILRALTSAGLVLYFRELVTAFRRSVIIGIKNCGGYPALVGQRTPDADTARIALVADPSSPQGPAARTAFLQFHVRSWF